VVNLFSLDDAVTAPVTGAVPVFTPIDTAQYEGTVEWQATTGDPFTGSAFAASTVYKAVVTLYAKAGYTFTGVAANSFAYADVITITNPLNSGIVTIVFQPTEPPAEAPKDTVNLFSLDDAVTAPVTGAAPVSTAIDTAQYEGTVEWQTYAGDPFTGSAFIAFTIYRAVVTLYAKAGYTFTGVAADSFTCTGASVTNDADSGVVIITFPATTAAPVSLSSLDGKVTAPVTGAAPVSTAIDTAQYWGTVDWQTSTGESFTGDFAASTIYKARVILYAKASYTFTGMADSFTCTGTVSVSVTNYASYVVIIITFPVTDSLFYQVIYDANGGAGAPPAIQMVMPGQSVTLANGDGLSKTEYIFSGWNTRADGGGVTYPAGAVFTPTERTTYFYARWANITGVESAAFSSAAGSNQLTVTLTGGTFAASPSLGQFVISTLGSGGFASLAGGTLVRDSDVQVTISGLQAVTSAGSGQKLTVAAAAQATQATAVTVTASLFEQITDMESAAFSSAAGNNQLTITLTGGTFAAPLSLGQFVITPLGSGGFASLAGGTLIRNSDVQVTISGLPAVTSAGSGQKLTVAAAAQATRATAVTVTASTAGGGDVPITDMESAAFSSAEGNNQLTVTLTGGTFAAPLSLEQQFIITTLGSGGFASLAGGTLVRDSDVQVTISGLPAVTSAGSGQKLTVTATAQATQATAVTVAASTAN
jgi:hypothetical protein